MFFQVILKIFVKIINYFRYDWYQTNTYVTLTILKRGLNPENCSVNYNEPTLLITINLNEILFKADLFALINKDELSWICTPLKVSFLKLSINMLT